MEHALNQYALCKVRRIYTVHLDVMEHELRKLLLPAWKYGNIYPFLHGEGIWPVQSMIESQEAMICSGNEERGCT